MLNKSKNIKPKVFAKSPKYVYMYIYERIHRNDIVSNELRFVGYSTTMKKLCYHYRTNLTLR